MYNGKIIERLLIERGLQKKELLDYLGSRRNGSISQLVKGNPTAANLEKIADFFNVSVDTLFIRNQQNKVHNDLALIERYKSENAALRDLVNEKERTIKVLMSRYFSEDIPGQNRDSKE